MMSHPIDQYEQAKGYQQQVRNERERDRWAKHASGERLRRITRLLSRGGSGYGSYTMDQ